MQATTITLRGHCTTRSSQVHRTRRWTLSWSLCGDSSGAPQCVASRPSTTACSECWTPQLVRLWRAGFGAWARRRGECARASCAGILGLSTGSYAFRPSMFGRKPSQSYAWSLADAWRLTTMLEEPSDIDDGGRTNKPESRMGCRPSIWTRPRRARMYATASSLDHGIRLRCFSSCGCTNSLPNPRIVRAKPGIFLGHPPVQTSGSGFRPLTL